MRTAFLMVFLTALFLLSPIQAADVTTFLSPDNSYSALREFLKGSESLYVASYTFTSPFIMDELLSLKANITVLVDKSPAGGLPEQSKKIFCKLEENGITVFLYNGSLRFMHAKYLIKNKKTVLLSTENLGEDGFPRKNNHGNRGWELIVEDENTAIDFMDIYIKDLADSVRFTCPFADYKIEYKEASGRYNPSFSLRSYSNQEVTAVFAPDAVSPIIELINSAKKSIYVEQFYIYTYWGEKESPFLEALIDRAREGIDVKVLLDSYQYNIEENDPKSNLHTFEYINEIAKKENLSMEARLIDLDKLGLEILHAKGMIVDNEKVLVSTINWNENSPKNNREVGIVVSGNAARYFVEAFMYDWEGGKTGSINTSVVILLAIALALVITIWRRRESCRTQKIKSL
jgi:phosphatidylserine/phosphatidylglycerophosphate/cardiolipin synthase-like enzyme